MPSLRDANLFPESSGTAGCARPHLLGRHLPLAKDPGCGEGTRTPRHPPPKLLPLLSPAACTHLQLPLCAAVRLSSVIYVGLKCIYFCKSLYFSVGPRGLRAEAACAHGRLPGGEAGAAELASLPRYMPLGLGKQQLLLGSKSGLGQVLGQGLREGHSLPQAFLVTAVALASCPAQVCWCRVWARAAPVPGTGPQGGERERPLPGAGSQQERRVGQFPGRLS